MIVPLGLAVAGVAVIAMAEWLSRRLAPRYLVGRTLAAARDVSIDEARRLAESAAGQYVRVHGRITSDEEFPDEQDRPLVYRRKRIEVRAADGKWRTASSETEGVPFGLELRSSFIGVDSAALGPGLVVVPRTAEGVGADLPAALADDVQGAAGVGLTDPRAAARLVVEQVSAVEHAYVAGVPARAPDGSLLISSGNRRPLILTTLEIDDAMRLLGSGQRGMVLGLAGLVGLGMLLLFAAVVTLGLGLGAAAPG